MKTDSRTLELYAAGPPDRQVTPAIRPMPVSLSWLASAVVNGGPGRPLFCSLLLHGALLLVALAGWTLLPMEQAPPSVISVFTVQQEGDPEAAGAGGSNNAPTVQRRQEPLAKKLHDNTETHPVSTSSPSAPQPANPETGRVAPSETPMHAPALQGIGSGDNAPGINPAAGAGEGAASNEVLARPLYTTNPPPPYPRLARKLGHEGVVQLEVLVSVAGRVDDLRLAASSGHESLDDAALEAVRSWRFSAGQRNGQPVAMRVRVPVRFSLRAGS